MQAAVRMPSSVTPGSFSSKSAANAYDRFYLGVGATMVGLFLVSAVAAIAITYTL